MGNSAATQITTVEALQDLPAGAVVHTGIAARTKTHDADEWDMVLDADEVLDEGDGTVKVLYIPGDADG